MKPVESTYRIVALKCLNRSVDMEWSDWAAEMMVRGYETEHLIELAGISEPFNQFELKELTDKVFEELRLDYKNQEKIVIDYATYCLKIGIKQKRPIISILEELKNLCIELDYETGLYDFYSLYFAKDDLNHSDIQYYWDDADRNNIDAICMEYFEKWLIQNPLGEYTDEIKNTP
jgi:hypothetical protein